MKDRVSQDPGRVLITPEDGSPAFYATMTRADNPIEDGDHINKATLLKDPTAVLYDLGITAVPDDVFRVLSRFQKGLGNEYVWAKEGYIAPTYTQKVVENPYLIDEQYYIKAQIADSIEVRQDGAVMLVNPSEEQSVTGGNLTALKGKYFIITVGFYAGSIDRDIVYYCPANATFEVVPYFSSYYWTPDALYQLTGVAEVADGLEYVNSPNSDAYPPAVDDGCRYSALGMLGAKANIAVGTYTGTGKHGSANPNSLTFGFEPKIVIIRCPDASGQNGNVIGTTFVRRVDLSEESYGLHYNDTYGMYSSYLRGVKWVGNTVYWYTDMGYPGDQLNATLKYYYVAIG